MEGDSTRVQDEDNIDNLFCYHGLLVCHTWNHVLV